MSDKRHKAIKAALFSIAAFTVLSLSAQTPEEEYRYISKYLTEEYHPRIEVDSSLFYRAVQATEDIFADIADYDLSFVSFSRRGERFYKYKAVFDGIPVRSEYRYALDNLKIDNRRYSGIRYSESFVGGAGGFTEYLSTLSEPASSRSAGVDFSGRGYWVGVRASFSETFGNGWSMSAFLSGRTGRDMHVKGVFTNAAESGIKLVKHWNFNHRITVAAMFSPSERGMRRASTSEAFTLTGDNLYNPSWGFQDGKVRNANVRRTAIPSLLAAYDAEITSRTTLTVSAGADVGVRKYSSLEWFDALTPLPDNYRFMPSYYDDDDIAADVESVWRNGDTRYTQIDWNELYEQNRMAGGHAVYAVSDRVERITALHLRASAVTHAGDNLTVGYGLHLSYDRSRNYRQMRDLLGSDYIIDIDQYLTDDAAYRNMLQNDLRHPNRTVRKGDRFGYDYALADRYAGAFASLDYRTKRLRIGVAAEIGDRSSWRCGFYEKELFSGPASCGRSGKVKSAPYTVKAMAGYSFTPRHYIELCGSVAGEAPEADDLFLQTQYNNRIIDNPRLSTVSGAEVNYTFLHRTINLRASLFATLTLDNCEVSHYFDDLAAEYCDMVVSGIDRLHFGAELAATVNISRSLKMSAAATVGRYTFYSDPRVTLYADTDNRLICDKAVAHLGDCKVGNAPQIAATADISYMNKGWGARLSVNYAGYRYVEPAPMRRTDRVSHQGSVSEEMFLRFVTQERLPDALTADGSVWKTFWLSKEYGSRSRIVLSLSVRNILGNSNMIYSARESVRVQRRRIAGGYFYAPFPTTYLYALPRTFRLSVSYRF